MRSLYKKELAGFFSSLTGYIVIIIFLLGNGLFLWVFPGEFNIIEAGYATLSPFFIIAPWIFLFLIPAVTMRMLSDEKKSGNLEVILSQPITHFQIVFSKYLASLTLVFIALLPCLIYFISVYYLGNPVGNIDTGGTWGSFIGLFFLAASYVAIGIFASAVTDNSIISFIVSLVICFFAYSGFDLISGILLFEKISAFIISLGINEHYQSMSRGVLDSRDLIYFIALISIFLLISKSFLKKN